MKRDMPCTVNTHVIISTGGSGTDRQSGTGARLLGCNDNLATQFAPFLCGQDTVEGNAYTYTVIGMHGLTYVLTCTWTAVLNLLINMCKHGNTAIV